MPATLQPWQAPVVPRSSRPRLVCEYMSLSIGAARSVEVENSIFILFPPLGFSFTLDVSLGPLLGLGLNESVEGGAG